MFKRVRACVRACVCVCVGACVRVKCDFFPFCFVYSVFLDFVSLFINSLNHPFAYSCIRVLIYSFDSSIQWPFVESATGYLVCLSLVSFILSVAFFFFFFFLISAVPFILLSLAYFADLC